jgi:hypothetical protein
MAQAANISWVRRSGAEEEGVDGVEGAPLETPEIEAASGSVGAPGGMARSKRPHRGQQNCPSTSVATVAVLHLKQVGGFPRKVGCVTDRTVLEIAGSAAMESVEPSEAVGPEGAVEEGASTAVEGGMANAVDRSYEGGR